VKRRFLICWRAVFSQTIIYWRWLNSYLRLSSRTKRAATSKALWQLVLVAATKRGTHDQSRLRCLALLREECPRDENNFYVEELES
jgi:hypothetical protein